MNSLSPSKILLVFVFSSLCLLNNILKKHKLEEHDEKKNSIDKSRWTLQAISISLKINKFGNCLFCWKKIWTLLSNCSANTSDSFPTMKMKRNTNIHTISLMCSFIDIIPIVIYYSEYILVGFGKRTQNISPCWHITFHSCSLINKCT